MAFIDLTWRTFRPTEGFYTSEVDSPQPLPVRTFLPFGYEPRYPYPLLVFFHGHGGNEEQILRLAPRLSRRNYISIGLRGPIRLDPRPTAKWAIPGATNPTWPCWRIISCGPWSRLCMNYHVHSERIYLAGLAEGANAAYRLGLTFPERLGGLISLNGCLPRHGRPLFRLPSIRSLRVFIGHGIANAVVPLSLAREDRRLLYSAGVDVEMMTYSATHRLHPDMLRDVNRWIIRRCNEE